MTRLKFRPLFLLALTAALAGLAACGDKSADTMNFDAAGKPSRGGVYVTASIGEASNLIPWIAGDSATSEITSNIYNALLKYDKNLNLTGDLAKSWDISPDGLTMTFHLRHNVMWEDNTPFTATDVMATFNAITNPETRTPYADKYSMVKHADVVDPYTFRVTYDKPFAPALASWAQLEILPAHILNLDPSVNESRLKTNPIGTGPYRLLRWAHGMETQLLAKDHFFRGAANIKLLRSRLITDLDAQFLALKKGTIDSMGLKPIQYERLTSGKDFTHRYAKYRYLGRQYVYMGFNLHRPLFTDKRVRQALSYATPRETIIKGVLLGQGVPSFGPFMPGTWAENKNLKPYPYDIAKAKELLAAAGWKDTDGDGILDKDGKPFSFTVVTNQGNDQRIKTAEIMQQEFRKVGVDMKIRVQEWATFIANTINARDFDAVILGWTLPPEPDPFDIWHSSRTGAKEFNFVGFNNPEADRLIEASRNTFDQAARQKALWKFQEILQDEQPYLFLYTPYSLIAIHKRIKGVEPAPAGIGYNFEQWYIPADQRLYNADELLK